ncbi:hypothetical protein CDAR_564721 [Caerostris darwini]|uniref:Uncharacterized protein n=1 Tax=Caerostris darwini TaxID=1538125 RepID=A0AAV4W5C7_9ARAC|nr:hypothetical protein CDAR_564721 [Caerostris darwini]
MEGIPNEGSEDSNLEKSICIDDVIFYGPITAKERIIRERFERRQKEKAALRLLPPLIDIGEQLKDNREEKINAEESKNEITTDVSIYESFSIDESKYESFDDSLDEGKNIYPNETNINFLSDQVNVNVRKLRANKMLKGSLCDSLEDIHSLVSNVEKLSISEEIESINVREKNHIYDDSLKNDICFENKNTSSNEQNFDEDSLAILELEKTFDDSLEEADILPLTHIDNLIILKNSKSETEISVENLSKENTCVTKNLFETSVQIIYENVRNDVEISEDQNYGIKQVSSTGDSLSISENMSKDSLEDLPVISKGKELQEELKNSESVILNNVKSDFLTNLGKIECINKTEMCEVTDLNPVIASNLSCIPFDFDNELSVHVNVSNSNNAILIEDSFELSSETSFSKKEQLENKLLINENIMKGVSSAINETIWIDDSFIEPHPVMNKNKTYSFNNEKSEKEKSDCDKQILSEINEYENFKKEDSPVCLISNIKKEESSSNKKLKDVNFNSKIKALSPVKDERFHNAKGKIFEAKTPNCGVESFISLKKSVGRVTKSKETFNR